MPTLPSGMIGHAPRISVEPSGVVVKARAVPCAVSVQFSAASTTIPPASCEVSRAITVTRKVPADRPSGRAWRSCRSARHCADEPRISPVVERASLRQPAARPVLDCLQRSPTVVVPMPRFPVASSVIRVAGDVALSEVVVNVSAVPCAVSVQFCAACTVMPPAKPGPKAVVP